MPSRIADQGACSTTRSETSLSLMDKSVTRVLTAALVTLIFAGALVPQVSGQSARAELLQAKQLATDANYRNSQPDLRKAIEQFGTLAHDPALTVPALYHRSWTRWMLAASEIVAARPDSALSALNAAVPDLRRAIELRPNDADTRALMAWTLMAIASADHSRWSEVSSELAEQRRRAVALAPKNPRVMIMDASMMFYAPPAAGGSQERAVAQWRDALNVFEAEKLSDPLSPDWGGALAYGWLANLYLQMAPPRIADARSMAAKALAMRPDFWWVTTQVVAKM